MKRFLVGNLKTKQEIWLSSEEECKEYILANARDWYWKEYEDDIEAEGSLEDQDFELYGEISS